LFVFLLSLELQHHPDMHFEAVIHACLYIYIYIYIWICIYINPVGYSSLLLDVACPSEVASQALNMGWIEEGGGGVSKHIHTHTHAHTRARTHTPSKIKGSHPSRSHFLTLFLITDTVAALIPVL